MYVQHCLLTADLLMLLSPFDSFRDAVGGCAETITRTQNQTPKLRPQGSVSCTHGESARTRALFQPLRYGEVFSAPPSSSYIFENKLRNGQLERA